ncbi:methyltransferase domain-containing protein [Acanthopleuribacter pedis]|uniref:Methyltransferase domain-containing protein n=1 Tax=Acanthopleuribacter pedis TaxID=442870 RepID=A0A8J7U0V5_9BACT|nr:methyltransferase domain-containing protein [Acanthopleuribacter pedis]
MKLDQFLALLRCPKTGKNLELVDLSQARADGNTSPELTTVPRQGGNATPVGVTDRILRVVGEDHAYPVVGDFPVLILPEMLVPADKVADYGSYDLHDPKYEEAYEEMDHYNNKCENMLKTMGKEDVFAMGALTPKTDIAPIAASFPEPRDFWIDAKHDSLSQLEAYQYLTPVQDKVFLQMGGSGSHVVKFLLAGAARAIHLTPMVGEAKMAMHLAAAFGVADRMICVIGVGEELPFADSSLDGIYAGGCFHHMQLANTSLELYRVLKAGGKFSGVDPWKTPLHTIGTRVIGKREPNVHCRPINPERIAPMQQQFKDMTVSRHGPLLRYAFLALAKLRINMPISVMMKVMQVDNYLGKPFGLGAKYGGSLVMAGTK